MLTQEVDAIIAEENLSDSNPSVIPDEAPVVETDDKDTPDEPADKPVEGDNPDSVDKVDEVVDKPTEDDKPVEKEEPKSDERSPTETIAEAKTLIQNLDLTEDKIFNQDGSVKPWSEVMPAGAFFASQLEPVKVTDKDGKTHEFMLISDVEKAFPEGFEAKNNLEQMKFERQIVANESKFEEAIKTYQGAEARYNEETGSLVSTRESNQRLGNEYKAMADQGLVPKVGDPSDPKFSESEAVKEMNKIMSWMEKTNTENAAKGLGKIESLYVAKQLMDVDGSKAEKADRAKQIDQERKEVASLSSSPTPDQGHKRQYQNIPMSRLADSIIAEENLR